MNETTQKKEHLYEDLKRRILTLDLEPGTDLEEVSLSKEYDISRTPLRDVFRSLAGEGYLVIRNNRGAQVSPMSQKSLHDFFLVAPMIYSAVSRLAARNAQPEHIRQLKAIQKKFTQALADDNVEQKVFYNDQFHCLIGQMADNPFLGPSLRRLLIDHARIAKTFYRGNNPDMKQDMETACRQHDEMIEAFRNQDEERAERLTREHWDLSRHSFERFITPSGLDIKMDTDR
ncbi:MAG: GntR family transcriptional regulator [Thiolinea sp.]